MSDRVAVILGGRLQQVASPDALYRDPDTLAVAQFVGTPRINVLPGERFGLPAAQVAVRPERLRRPPSIPSPVCGGGRRNRRRRGPANEMVRSPSSRITRHSPEEGGKSGLPAMTAGVSRKSRAPIFSCMSKFRAFPHR